MRAVALLSLVAGASAFVPSALNLGAQRSRAGALKMSFEAEAGVVAPLGYFDPLGFSNDGDVDKFNRYRAVEIKHGRVAQLAVLHYFTTYFYKLPGSWDVGAIADVPAGLGSLSKVPPAAWAQILLFASALEILAPQKDDKAPGDVQPDTPMFKKLEQYDEEGALEIQNKEINNGRLAMIAITGMWATDALTGGQHPIDTLLSKLGGQ